MVLIICYNNPMSKLLRAIFIDVDGTLRSQQGEISARNQAALQLAQSHGIETVICTGRPRQHALELCRSIKSGDYCVFCNGAGVLDVKQNKLLYKSLIPSELTLKICELGWSLPNSEGIFWNFECVDAHYLSREVEGHMNGKIVIPEPLEAFLDHHEVMQLVACHLDDIDLMRKFSQKVSSENFGLKVLNQQKHMANPAFPPKGIPYIDFGNNDTSKGLGVREFCKLVGFSSRDCVAIGDDDNDLSMFEECGYKVAMDNALPEVKAMADFITKDNDHDGVAEFIENLVLGR